MKQRHSITIAKAAAACLLLGLAMPAQVSAANVAVSAGSADASCESAGFFTPAKVAIDAGDTVTFTVPAGYPNLTGVEIHNLPGGSFLILPGGSHTSGALTADASYYATWPLTGCQKGAGAISITTPPTPTPVPAPSPSPSPGPGPLPSPTPASPNSSPAAKTTTPAAASKTKPAATTAKPATTNDTVPAVAGASTTIAAISPSPNGSQAQSAAETAAAGITTAGKTGKSGIMTPAIIIAVVAVVAVAGALLVRNRLVQEGEPEEASKLPPAPLPAETVAPTPKPGATFKASLQDITDYHLNG